MFVKNSFHVSGVAYFRCCSNVFTGRCPAIGDLSCYLVVFQPSCQNIAAVNYFIIVYPYAYLIIYLGYNVSNLLFLSIKIM
jgi:hypothetical protein